MKKTPVLLSVYSLGPVKKTVKRERAYRPIQLISAGVVNVGHHRTAYAVYLDKI